MSILKSPIFISSIITLVSILIALGSWFFPQSTEVKSLSLGIVTSIDSININAPLKKENLKIFYNENVIDNLGYIKFRLKNEGTVPVAPEDYVEELKLVFPNKTTILDFSINPSQITTIQISGSSTIVFGKKLLNPGDFVDVEVIIETGGENINPSNLQVSGRIIGIKNIVINEIDKYDLVNEEERRQMARTSLLQTFKSILLFVVCIIIFVPIIKLLDYKGNNSLFQNLSKIIKTVGGGFVILFFIGTLLFYVCLLTVNIWWAL